MKTPAKLLLFPALAALCGPAAADGINAGQDAQAARLIARAYATQTVVDQTQVVRGNGHPGQAGATLNMQIAPVYASGGFGQTINQQIYVREAVQICMHC